MLHTLVSLPRLHENGLLDIDVTWVKYVLWGIDEISELNGQRLRCPVHSKFGIGRGCGGIPHRLRAAELL